VFAAIVNATLPAFAVVEPMTSLTRKDIAKLEAFQMM
jgi:hypothetical protein